MKDGFTRLALVLDRSGSMASIEEATVAGVNKFIEEQKQVPGTATLKLVQFDDVYEEVFDSPIAEAPELTLSKTPREGQRTYEPRAAQLSWMPSGARSQNWEVGWQRCLRMNGHPRSL